VHSFKREMFLTCVAFSKVGSTKGLYILVPTAQTTNAVYKEVLC
jgi:hypothetical protein